MKKINKAIAAVLALALAVGMTGLAWAAGTQTDTDVPGTDVWLSVVPRPTQERISVTLPIALAFVVDGTVDAEDDSEISVENGTLLLPNVRVEAESDTSYKLTTTGESAFVVRNYSTNVPEEYQDDEDPQRVGIEVELTASIRVAQTEDGDAVKPADRADWTLTGEKPSLDQDGYKKFRLSLDGNLFSIPENAEGKNEPPYLMDGSITLGAPPAHINGWTAGGVSQAPFEQEIEVDVEIGGTRNLYKKAETSVKAAEIIWTVRGVPLSEDPGDGS